MKHIKTEQAFIHRAQIPELLGISTGSFDKFRRQYSGLEAISPGRSVMFKRDEVIAWFEQIGRRTVSK